jgi:hypothetical protein
MSDTESNSDSDPWMEDAVTINQPLITDAFKVAKRKQQMRECSKKWYEKNLDKRCEINRKWRKKNPDKNREYCRNWREKNPEYYSKWYKNNREHSRENSRRWREKNKNTKIGRNNYFRMSKSAAIKQRDLEWELTLKEFNELREGECYYCGRSSDEKLNGVDRIINELGYFDANCVSSCWDCNWIKGNKSYDDFISYAEFLSQHALKITYNHNYRDDKIPESPSY